MVRSASCAVGDELVTPSASSSTIIATRSAAVPRCASVQATPMLKCSGISQIQAGNGAKGEVRAFKG